MFLTYLILIEDLKKKSLTKKTESDTVSDTSKPDSYNAMHNQRMVDLLDNIKRHALPKKVKLFKQAFINSEGLKIKKFEDKIRKEKNAQEYITQKHKEIMKSKTIKKILKEEQDREYKHNKQWYTLLSQKEKEVRHHIINHQKPEYENQIKSKAKLKIMKSRSHQKLKKNSNIFHNAFAQAKNVIEKQLKVGHRIKTRNETHKMLSEKIKTQKSSRNMPTKGKEILLTMYTCLC